uniref:Uncharacterized protein n=1 Tax=Panagrellus redivivus TaxID=6233 RepID=A0A7E4VKT4_PANRE
MLPPNGVGASSSHQHFLPPMFHQQGQVMSAPSDQPATFRRPTLPNRILMPLQPAENHFSPIAQPCNDQPGDNESATPAAVPSNPINFTADETLGRASPEEFPENVPGAWDFIRKQRVLTPGVPSMRFRTELDANDVKLVNELGQLSVDNLLDYMKNLKDNAYVLGEEEAREFQRSRTLEFYRKPSVIKKGKAVVEDETVTSKEAITEIPAIVRR